MSINFPTTGFRPPPGAPPAGGPPPPGAPGSEKRQAADAAFGPGAGDAFKQAFDTLATGGNSKFANAAGMLETALKSGDITSLKNAAQTLEGLVKDKVANPEQAGGISSAIALLKSKIGALSEASGQTDSFEAASTSSTSKSTGTSSTSGASSTSGTSSTSSASSTTAAYAPRQANDAFFGPGGFDTMNAAKDLLGTQPNYGNAGMALSYVMKSVAEKGTGNLTDTDYGAIQQAIIQMQSLVNAKQVNPAQAGVLNNAIYSLQGALTR